MCVIICLVYMHIRILNMFQLQTKPNRTPARDVELVMTPSITIKIQLRGRWECFTDRSLSITRQAIAQRSSSSQKGEKGEQVYVPIYRLRQSRGLRSLVRMRCNRPSTDDYATLSPCYLQHRITAGYDVYMMEKSTQIICLRNDCDEVTV